MPKRKIIAVGNDPVRGHPQYYWFSTGHEPGEFWVHGAVRARSPEKAYRKARRVQLKTDWPFLRVDPLPCRRQVDD